MLHCSQPGGGSKPEYTADGAAAVSRGSAQKKKAALQEAAKARAAQKDAKAEAAQASKGTRQL